jgi:hypothetical protein
MGESGVSKIKHQLTHCALPPFAWHELSLIQMQEDPQRRTAEEEIARVATVSTVGGRAYKRKRSRVVLMTCFGSCAIGGIRVGWLLRI